MRAREEAFYRVQGFVGARGIATSRCRSPDMLLKVARKLFAVDGSEIDTVADQIHILTKKERAARAARNLRHAIKLLPQEPATRSFLRDEDDDDGSQEALDRWALEERNRMIARTRATIRFGQKGSDADREAAGRYLMERFRVCAR